MIDLSEAVAAAERLRIILTMILLLTLGLVIAAAVSGTTNHAEMVAAVTGRAGWTGPPLMPVQEVALAMIGFVHLGFWLALLLIARSVMGHFAKADLGRAALRGKTLAYVLWALFGWVIVAGALGSVALSWHLPVGERSLAIGIGSTQISLAIAALIAAFMARVFALCADLWQDHSEVI